MGDEKFYKQVEDELNGKPRKFTDRALMTKAEVLAEGDKEKARYRYIQLRVEFLKNKEEEENKILALKEEQENKALALKKEEERNIKITKEKKQLSNLVLGLGFVAAFLFGRFFGLLGAAAIIIGIFAFNISYKNNTKNFSIFISLASGLVSYFLGLIIFAFLLPAI